MLGIQIVGILFGLFMIYYSFLNYKKKQFSRFEFACWMVLWLGLIFITSWPHSVDFFVEKIFTMQRPLDFFVVSGFLLLTALAFYNYNLARKNQKQLETIVQKITFAKAEKEMEISESGKPFENTKSRP